MMPFVSIRIVKQAIAADPAGKKAAISEKVTAAIAEATGLPQRDVWLVFDEVDAENWYLGENSVHKLRFE
jgi:4-oxalocrotonate tautomerase